MDYAPNNTVVLSISNNKNTGFPQISSVLLLIVEK